MKISQEGILITLINVFDTSSDQQQALVDQWVDFTEAVKDESGFLGAALHKSTDGTRVINYAQWRSQADLDDFLHRHGADFAQFTQNASRIDPHTYDIVYLAEQGGDSSSVRDHSRLR